MPDLLKFLLCYVLTYTGVLAHGATPDARAHGQHMSDMTGGLLTDEMGINLNVKLGCLHNFIKEKCLTKGGKDNES